MVDEARIKTLVRHVVAKLDDRRGEGELLPFLDRVEVDFMPHVHDFNVRLDFSDDYHFSLPLGMRGDIGRFGRGDSVKNLCAAITAAYIEEGFKVLNRRAIPYGPMEVEIAPIHIEQLHSAYKWRHDAKERIHEREMRAARDRMARDRYLPFFAADAFWPMAYLPDPVQVRIRPLPLIQNAANFLRAMGEHLGADSHTDTARRRGRALLLSNLSPEQRKRYESEGFFDVRGGTTGDTYRLLHGTHLNILRLRDSQGLCVIPRGMHMVYGDVLLSQKLALELEEEKALDEAQPFSTDPVTRRKWFDLAKKQQAEALARDG